MSDEKQTIVDRSDLRKWRIELPNLYDDSDLDPYEFRLLAHYKRVGLCTEGLTTTARKCKMSKGKVSQVRQSLADKGFIRLAKIETPNGPGYRVEVVDIWEQNFAHYSTLKKEKNMPTGGGHNPSPHEGYPSPHEGKKEPFKKEQQESCGTVVPHGATPFDANQTLQRVEATLARFAAFSSPTAVDLSKCPEHLMPLAKAFIAATGIQPVSQDWPFWKRSLTYLYDCGITPEEVRTACEEMIASELNVSSPASIAKRARNNKARRDRPSPIDPKTAELQKRYAGIKRGV